MVTVAPSLLSADFAQLAAEIESVQKAGADWLHFDVMDGMFVPNLSMGLPVLEAVRRCTTLPLDVHLMIEKPVRYVRAFCQAGADVVTVHVEADTEQAIRDALLQIHDEGKQCGISLKPGSPWEASLPFWDLADLILVMTVEPGFGGQRFMESQMGKLRSLRDRRDQIGREILLETDGGVDADTARICREHGVDVLVAGSAVFHARDRAAAIRAIRGMD